MNAKITSYVRKAFLDQRGQVLPYVALVLVSLLITAGLTIDVGHAYVVRAQLQSSTNAAALAAAGEVYTSGSATPTSVGQQYSAVASGDNNFSGSLTGVNTTVTTLCLNLLMPAGTTCSGNSNLPNAVRVNSTATVSTYFLRVAGVDSFSVGAEATASMQGTSSRWNVAIIQDATGSMSNTDGNCGSISQFQCALNGIETFLTAVSPGCSGGQVTCAPADATTRVALFTFPNIVTNASGVIPRTLACSATPQYQVYTLPLPAATSYVPLTYTENGSTWTASYEFTLGASDADANGFVSDWSLPSSTSTGGLNPDSSLVQAVGYGNGAVTGCLPISPAGIVLNGATGTSYTNAVVNTVAVGEGITYYASVIYAAQSALIAEQNLYPSQTSKNAIILLSDGQANTQWIYFPQGTVIPSGNPAQGKTNTAKPSTIASNLGYDVLNTQPLTTAYVAGQLSTPNYEVNANGSTAGISGVYPDFLDECQQAIVAAQTAALAGTRVYAVAYGSEDSGCGKGSHADDYTDVTSVTFPGTLNVSWGLVSNLTPCLTMENIASNIDYFYSDYNQSGSGVDSTCKSPYTVTELNNIYLAIAASMQKPKLVPNDAT